MFTFRGLVALFGSAFGGTMVLLGLLIDTQLPGPDGLRVTFVGLLLVGVTSIYGYQIVLKPRGFTNPCALAAVLMAWLFAAILFWTILEVTLV